MENHIKRIDIYGSGQEFIIGSINDEDFEAVIKNDEDIEEVFDDIEEIDDILHMYGAEIEGIEILDENGGKLKKLKNIVLSYQLIDKTKDRHSLAMELTKEINDCDDVNQIAEQILQSNPNIFNHKYDSTTFLIQRRYEKGYWGTVEFNKDINHIALVSAKLKVIDSIAPNILIGILAKGAEYHFYEIDTDESSTRGTTTVFNIYHKEKGITWTSDKF